MTEIAGKAREIVARVRTNDLFTIRGFTTLIVVTTSCVMAYQGKVEPKDFLQIVTLIVTFWFVSAPDRKRATDPPGTDETVQRTNPNA